MTNGKSFSHSGMVERVKLEEDKKIWEKKQAFHQTSATVCTMVCGLGAEREGFEYLPGQGRRCAGGARDYLSSHYISDKPMWTGRH